MIEKAISASLAIFVVIAFAMATTTFLISHPLVFLGLMMLVKFVANMAIFGLFVFCVFAILKMIFE